VELFRHRNDCRLTGGTLRLATTQPLRAGLAGSGVLGALATGAVAFSVGFFGPIIFTPNAHQDPLLGIFITGPLGLVLGAVGARYTSLFASRAAQRRAMIQPGIVRNRRNAGREERNA